MYVNKLKSTKITWIWTDRYTVDLDREIEMLVNFMVVGGSAEWYLTAGFIIFLELLVRLVMTHTCSPTDFQEK